MIPLLGGLDLDNRNRRREPEPPCWLPLVVGTLCYCKARKARKMRNERCKAWADECATTVGFLAQNERHYRLLNGFGCFLTTRTFHRRYTSMTSVSMTITTTATTSIIKFIRLLTEWKANTLNSCDCPKPNCQTWSRWASFEVVQGLIKEEEKESGGLDLILDHSHSTVED
jgi:hypothetical protein